MNDPEVTAVIVSYNSAEDLSELLPALADPRIEVLVVDNGSRDASLEVCDRFAHVAVAPLQSNTGWTAACNTGARRARGRRLAFVNPDARPTGAQLLELGSRVGGGGGSVSPRFTDEEGGTNPFYFRYPNPLSGLLTFTAVGRRLDDVLGGRAMSHRLYHGRPERAQVDQPGAACLVVDRKEFLSRGGFDESMWLFFSDAAWCRTRSAEGGRHVIAWDVDVPHMGGTTVDRLSSESIQRLFQRDYFAYARAVYSRPGQLVTLLGLLLLGAVLPALAAAAKGKGELARRRLGLGPDLVRIGRGHVLGPLDG